MVTHGTSRRAGWRGWRALLVGMALAVGLGAPVAASAARPPEPAPVEETIGSAPGPGYVWVPGHWDWHAFERRYSWEEGYWAPTREVVAPPAVVVGPRFVWGPRYSWHPYWHHPYLRLSTTYHHETPNSRPGSM